jgi:hypothetical protein
VSVAVYFPVVAKKQLGEGVPAETNNFWKSIFLCDQCRMKRKVGAFSFKRSSQDASVNSDIGRSPILSLKSPEIMQ